MPNRFLPFTPPVDDNQLLAMLNKNFGELDNENITKVYRGPNNNPTLIEGKLPNDLGYGAIYNDADGVPLIYMAVDGDNEPVLKVAKAGKDATTANNSDLIFNSANNLFKIVGTGTQAISHAHGINSALTTSIPHGQSGRPTVICFATNLVAPGISSSSPSYQMPVIAPGVSGGNLVISMLLQAYVDGMNLNIYTWSNPATTITANIKYYILQETAN